MLILADENVPGVAVDALRAAGNDVLWARTEMPGRPDFEVLDRAQRDQRLLLTFDKDFGELAFHQRLPASSGVILLRVSVPSPETVAHMMVAVLSSRSDWPGHFSVVEDDKMRMTPLPATEP